MSAHSLSVADVLARAAAMSLYCGPEGKSSAQAVGGGHLFHPTPRRGRAHRAGAGGSRPHIEELRTLGLAPELADALEQGAELARRRRPHGRCDARRLRLPRLRAHGAGCRAGALPRLRRLASHLPPLHGHFQRRQPRPAGQPGAPGPGAGCGGASSATWMKRHHASLGTGGMVLQRALQHLMDAQGVFAGRLDRMLAEENPPVAVEFVWTMAGQTQTTRRTSRRLPAQACGHRGAPRRIAHEGVGSHRPPRRIWHGHCAPPGRILRLSRGVSLPLLRVKRRQLGVPAV